MWRSDGPHADHPIAYVSGLWSLTWILQVLSLFFVAGGYVHSLAWSPHRDQPSAWRRFAVARARTLCLPTLVLVLFVATSGVIVGNVHAGPDRWITPAVLLVLSPLWFLIVYLMLVVTVPIWDRLDRRWGEPVPLALAAGAMAVDVLWFRHDVEQVAWLHMLLVGAACHQMGRSWTRLRHAPSRFGHALTILGFATLVGLTTWACTRARWSAPPRPPTGSPTWVRRHCRSWHSARRSSDWWSPTGTASSPSPPGRGSPPPSTGSRTTRCRCSLAHRRLRRLLRPRRDPRRPRRHVLAHPPLVAPRTRDRHHPAPRRHPHGGWSSFPRPHAPGRGRALMD